MKSVISLPYFGNLLWFQSAIMYQPLIENHENYQKKSWRNKTIILGANGPKMLSVPLQKGKHKQMPYKDVLISYEENWTKTHIQGIYSAYGNAAYFEHYFPDIEKILLQKPVLLWELNQNLNARIFQWISFGESLTATGQYLKKEQYLLDLRNEKLINLVTNDMKYPQVFEDKFGFVNDLSILDLLFNMGPETLSILKSSIKQKEQQ